MKNIKQLFTALLLLCSIVAMADTVTIGGITYDVVAKAKQAKVIAMEAGYYSGSVVIPESIVYNDVTYSVTSIGNSAFCWCYGLTSITIPNSVTSIGDGAFSECYALTSITIPNSVTRIGGYAFWGCYGLTSVTIPNSVTRIGNNAFEGCSGLTSITIPNSVTRIGNNAFEGCSGLTSITIPNSVTSIGISAFSGCSGLTSITIGSGVKNIDYEAFAKCENLTDVYCLATKVPSTNSDAFNESYPEYMTLHVPAEAINSYKTTAPWRSFGTIVTIEEEGMPKCATPIISYSNGKLETECETEGAEFVISITSEDFNNFYSSSVDLSVTYNIAVYAMLEGYENSDTVNATLCWIENGDSDEDDTTNIITVPAVAVLVTSANGAVTVNCSLEGENVEVYTTDGTLVGAAAITNGSATVQSGLSKGSVAIVKIGAKSVKVVVD
ncbi:MAG: leucine-rich repeat domain-containing protein [Bacteroidaceae bacterium]|nr:leucine-rich repeat domain-containing protein [Bacteroidaceae bacterium]